MPHAFGYAVPNNTIWAVIDASRTTGVAPLAVHFDACRCVAPGITTFPFHELDYAWSFGDAGAGSWTYGGNTSKNAAYGPIAAHVFETPGTYTVTLTVKSASQTKTTSVQIVVSDPDVVFSGTNTVCVRATATGGFTGAPAGSSQVTQIDWPTIVSTYCGTGKRVLLRKGDTFTSAASGGTITNTGPGTVDAFGSGANPIIQLTSSDTTSSVVSWTPNGGLSDWRIRNITFDPNGFNARMCNPFGNKRLLFQGLVADGMYSGIEFDGQGTLNNEQIFLVETNIQNLAAGDNHGLMSYMDGAYKCGILGNYWHNSANGEHVFRMQRGVKTVTSNNYLSTPASFKANFLLHASTLGAVPTAGALPSYQNILSDNYFVGASTGIISIVPENNSYNEPIVDTIVERNYIVSGATTVNTISVEASRTTIRLNIFDGTLKTSDDFYGVVFDWHNLVPLPENNWVYNNTMYTPSTTLAWGTRFIHQVGATTVQNNLLYCPSVAGTHTVIHDSSPSTSITSCVSCNSSDAQAKSTDPKFADATPAAPSEYALQAGSYAISGGVDVPVFYDFFRTAISSGAYNIGAINSH